jgi:hypothetical protein
MGLRETLARLPSEIAYALDYSDEPYDWTPFLQDLMVSVERLRLQGPEAGRISEKAQQKLVEAIANFRAELFIRRVLRGE